jgi:hypothetical protein
LPVSAKRKHGSPRKALDVDVHPDNWEWLYLRSKTRGEAMGIVLDKILSAFREVSARSNLTQDH